MRCRCASAKHTQRGVLLKRIAKGSLADRANLYPGDTIVSVNGQLVNHHQDAVQAIDNVRDLVKLVVVRARARCGARGRGGRPSSS